MYYPNLLERYTRGDSTMTVEEKQHLYYGFLFHENYAPYRSSGFEDSLRQVLTREPLNEADFLAIVRFSDSVLARNPFSTRTLNYQAYAYRKLGRQDQWRKNVHKFRAILDAIINSGDGKSTETAFFVTSVEHEYSLIHALDFEFGGTQRLVDGQYDYMALKENDFNVEGLYFNVSASMDHLNRSLRQKDR